MEAPTAHSQNSLTATVVGSVLLGRISVNGRRPRALNRLRDLIIQLQRELGSDGLNQYNEKMRPVVHAFVDALFDRVTGTSRPETATRLAALDVPERTTVEAVVAQMTGQMSSDPERRWDNDLWRLKGQIDKVCTNSISRLTPADIRHGYNDLVHEVVDYLLDHWISAA